MTMTKSTTTAQTPLNASKRSRQLARSASGPLAGFAPADVLHRQAEQHHRDEARQDAGGEQLADAGVGHDPVDDHDGRRRDQDAERPARGDRADRELVGIVVLAHRRIGDLGHRRRGRDRRAADRAEACAREHGRHRQAAAQVADDGVAGAVELLRHAGAGDEVAHQDEERHHRQRVLEARLVDDRRRRRHRRAEAAHPPQAEEADQAHRDRDRHAQERDHKHDGEADQCFGHVALR
jgi:hypothetical protein